MESMDNEVGVHLLNQIDDQSYIDLRDKKCCSMEIPLFLFNICEKGEEVFPFKRR